MSRPSTSRQSDPPYVAGAKRPAIFDEMKYEDPRQVPCRELDMPASDPA